MEIMRLNAVAMERVTDIDTVNHAREIVGGSGAMTASEILNAAEQEIKQIVRGFIREIPQLTGSEALSLIDDYDALCAKMERRKTSQYMLAHAQEFKEGIITANELTVHMVG